MLTIENYFDWIRNIDLNSLHPTLQESHEWVREATNDGADWGEYHTNSTIREVIDFHLQQMEEYQKKHKNISKSPRVTNTQKNKKSVIEVRNKRTEATAPKFVPRVADELRFIKRYLNMHNKTHSKQQILTFVTTLQKAIIEKRIRKTSPWAEEINYIQGNLIDIYNSMKESIITILKPDTLAKLMQFVNDEKLLPSVGFIKRYISLHKVPGAKDKASSLLTQIDRSYEKGGISKNDPYLSEMDAIRRSLQSYIADKHTKSIVIEPVALSGLQNILSGLSGCACVNQLNGPVEDSQIMSSVDFVKRSFPTIGLTGKYRDFIGDPSPGFTAMISARPKFGKSTLCADFAGYLARVHGPVLFVAKEEGFSKTLRDKLEAIKHPRLMVAASLPHDLSLYQYIFLDSVTRLGLLPDDLRELKRTYPDKCFVYVFQVTKAGKFRGGNDFQHDVDVVIELPQPGKAIQFGRFNQGGELNVFDKDSKSDLYSLAA